MLGATTTADVEAHSMVARFTHVTLVGLVGLVWRQNIAVAVAIGVRSHGDANDGLDQ